RDRFMRRLDDDEPVLGAEQRAEPDANLCGAKRGLDQPEPGQKLEAIDAVLERPLELERQHIHHRSTSSPSHLDCQLPSGGGVPRSGGTRKAAAIKPS